MVGPGARRNARSRNLGRHTGPTGGGTPIGIADVSGTSFEPKMERQRWPSSPVWDSHDYGPAQVTVSGPINNGRIAEMIPHMIGEMMSTLAMQGFADVHQNLDQHIQFPTPYYETQVMIQPMGDDLVVHDRGIVYGPWLEGVSQRNQTTRFKGYHSFRKAADELRRKAAPLLQPIVDRWAQRMNG